MATPAAMDLRPMVRPDPAAAAASAVSFAANTPTVAIAPNTAITAPSTSASLVIDFELIILLLLSV
jgi:hypothetical protein